MAPRWRSPRPTARPPSTSACGWWPAALNRSPEQRIGPGRPGRFPLDVPASLCVRSALALSSLSSFRWTASPDGTSSPSRRDRLRSSCSACTEVGPVPSVRPDSVAWRRSRKKVRSLPSRKAACGRDLGTNGTSRVTRGSFERRSPPCSIGTLRRTIGSAWPACQAGHGCRVASRRGIPRPSCSWDPWRGYAPRRAPRSNDPFVSWRSTEPLIGSIPSTGAPRTVGTRACSTPPRPGPRRTATRRSHSGSRSHRG